MLRRSIIKAMAGLAGAGASVMTVPLLAQPQALVEVWKDPNCGCCKDWVQHLEANGFKVRVHETGNTAARARLGVPEKLGSCHTAQVGGYAIEGHVPVREIYRLLKERPSAIGIAVPGMPVGSPAMDGAEYGKRRDPYDVLLINKDLSTRVFQSYNRI
ncbi:DUF411 domain-containing protein [Polaromonas sp.]|uniref:DUF411 domain-containing protein n=1 Tax=Polaromonas sp. TaxID=1869339 RepID=UPI002FC6D1A9